MSSTIEKPVCSYGEKCFRKNKDHIENYDHPEKPAKRQRVDAKTMRKEKGKTSEVLIKTIPEGPRLVKETIDLTEIKGLIKFVSTRT
jgi:hypothetical protein